MVKNGMLDPRLWGILTVMLSGCAPTVQVAPPTEPIVINLNVKIEHDVRVRLEKDVEALMKKDDHLF